MITEAELGLAVRRNATVGELLEAWFELAAGDFSPSTVKAQFYDRDWRRDYDSDGSTPRTICGGQRPVTSNSTTRSQPSMAEFLTGQAAP